MPTASHPFDPNDGGLVYLHLPMTAQRKQQEQYIRSILNAYSKSSSTQALPSLARFNQYLHDDLFSVDDGVIGKTNWASDETGWGGSARAVGEEDKGRVEGEEDQAVDGTEAIDVVRSREFMLSALLVGLHRRVMWKQMVCSTVNPITPERRTLYSANPG